MAEVKTEKYDAIVYASQNEKEIHKAYVKLFKESPIPGDETLENLGLFLTSKNLARILFFAEIYKKIVTTHGVIMEFGTRWGNIISLMASLRGIFEPFNRHRKIIGFDTFSGLEGIGIHDGAHAKTKNGSYSVSNHYEEYLHQIMQLQECLNPISHLQKFEIVKGNAAQTVPDYFKKHPETLISLAIFDFDIYQPTKSTLDVIRPYLCKGSILVFDELCDELFPGETVALREVIGTNQLRIERLPMTSRISYLEWGA